MSLALLSTVAEPHPVMLEAVLPEEARYWWRTNEHFAWTRIHTRSGIEQLVRSRCARDPWVTIARVFGDFDPDGGPHQYFQTLQGDDPSAVFVSGGRFLGGDSGWEIWTSWCAGVPRGRTVLLGPRWYQQLAWSACVQTAHDALTQLWPALDGSQDGEAVVPGYLWRPVTLDPQ